MALKMLGGGCFEARAISLLFIDRFQIFQAQNARNQEISDESNNDKGKGDDTEEENTDNKDKEDS